MNKSIYQVLRAITGSSLILLLMTMSACGGGDKGKPEDQVKAVLDAIEQGVEARSLSQIMEHVSEDYIDHQGQDKKAIGRLMQFQILRNQNINIFTRIRDLQINDNGTATVELSAAMASGQIDLSIESNRLRADTHRFSVYLHKPDDNWLVKAVSWKQGW